MINVKNWTFDSQAIGKLRTVWAKFGKVPGCFRHFFRMCEFAASLGPVLKVDMDSITLEKVRAKVGVRDFDKILAFTEITCKDLMIYRISIELDSVVEHGWYNEFKRQSLEVEEQEGLGDDMRKNNKGWNMGGTMCATN